MLLNSELPKVFVSSYIGLNPSLVAFLRFLFTSMTGHDLDGWLAPLENMACRVYSRGPTSSDIISTSSR